MRYVTLAFSAGLLFCSACLVGPNYSRPKITPPTAWKHATQTEAPAEHSVQLGVWPEADWWKRFKNEELTSYIETALRQNQDLRIAVARVEQARAQARQTRANEFPNVNLDPAATRTHNSENLTSFNLNRSTSTPAGGFSPRVFTPGRTANIFNAPLDAGYEIDFWGRNRRATESARADLAATEQDRRTVFISLISEVATTYFTLSELDELLDTTRRAVELRKENLKLTQGRFQAGLVSELDVAQSKTQLALTEAQLPDLERRRAQAEHQLAVLLGENPEQRAVPTRRLREVFYEPEIPGGPPSELVERRPDILAAENRLRSAGAQIGVAKAALFPQISLTGSGGVTSSEFSNWFNWASRVWSIGPALRLPIFDAGSRRARIEFSKAKYEEAVAQYQKSILRAFQEVEDTLVALRTHVEQTTADQRAADAALRSLELARIRYKQGLSNYLPVLEAERALLDAQNMVIQGKAARLTDIVSMYKALGGGW